MEASTGPGVFGPFKCPDCGTWWAGFEHRCAKPVTTPDTGPILPPSVPWAEPKTGDWPYKPDTFVVYCDGS